MYICFNVGLLGRCDHASTVAKEFTLFCARVNIICLCFILILTVLLTLHMLYMMSVYIFPKLIFIATPKVFIVYCKEDADDVLQLSNFLHANGINCDIDQYYSAENITDQGHWSEERIKECCASNGFILLICSKLMYQHLCGLEMSTVEMVYSCISSLSLRNTIH